MIPWFRWVAWKVPLPFGDGELALEPFSLLVLLAMVVVIVVAAWFAKRHQRSVAQTLDFAAHVLLVAFPISYLLNGLLYEPHALVRFLSDPSEVFHHRLGWSMYGGIIGGIGGAWVWKWRRDGSILDVGDAYAFAGPFGWCIARIGCFGVHDHPGRVSRFPLAVANYQVGSPPFQPRHDLGLYDAILLGSIAVLFLFLSRRPRKPGFYLASLALLHPPARFLLDFLRAPVSEGGDIRYAGLTPSQYGAVGFFIVGVALMRRVSQSDLPPT